MYVPTMYTAPDADAPATIIDEHPLAVLVTNGDGGIPWATHLPVIVPASARPALRRDDGGGAGLLGHMNRANPHWSSLHDGDGARLVFQGPGGYVSPAVYPAEPSAPTWDFVSVHVRGSLRIITDRDETMHVVRATAGALERRFGDGWCPASSLPYFEQLLSGVGAFEFHVEDVEAMFKLSQEKPADVRRDVADWLGTGSGRDARRLAELVRGTVPPERPECRRPT